MKRYKMLYLLVILALSGSLSVGTATAQEEQTLPVVILVVDDFTVGSIFDNMLNIYNALDDVPIADITKPALDALLSQLEEIEGFAGSLPSPESLAGAEEIGQGVNDFLTSILGGDTLSGSILSTSTDVAAIFEEFGFPIDILEKNCAVTYADQGLFSTTPTGLFSTTPTGLFSTTPTGLAPGQSHGEVVEDELDDFITRYSVSDKVELARVETENYTTESITQGIVEQILNREPGTDFVVNMSFAIVPCGRITDIILYEKLLASADPALAAELARLRELLTQLVMHSDVLPLLSGDPLFSILGGECPEEFEAFGSLVDYSTYYSDATGICDAINMWGGELVSVAAAGNSDADYPYYPAAWETVVSVSADDSEIDFDSTATLADYSNWGAVMLSGTWNGNQGTSFAAPRYSFAQALRLWGLSAVDIGCDPSVHWDPPLPDDWLDDPPLTPNQSFCH